VFAPGGNSDEWTDFMAGPGTVDKIDLAGFDRHFHLGDILSKTTQNGPNAIIDFGRGDSLTLDNVSKTNLHFDDFVGLKSTSKDFGGDGTSDLLWRSDNGQVITWSMNGHTYGGANLGTLAANWQIADTGDIDNDGRQDILFRDTSGDLVVWKMNGGTHTGYDFGRVR
jgi:hypothetical protein